MLIQPSTPLFDFIYMEIGKKNTVVSSTKWYERLQEEFKLVVLKQSSFEQKIALSFSWKSLIVWLGVAIIVLLMFLIYIISFTPLKYYIPGYAADNKLQQKVVDLSSKVDSLSYQILVKDKFVLDLQSHLLGTSKNGIDKSVLVKDSTQKYNNINPVPAQEELAMRDQVEKESKYTIFQGNKTNTSTTTSNTIFGLHFFPPVQGALNDGFDVSKRHFGVDIAVPKSQPIKSTLDGTVVLATWTAEDGHVIQVQHTNNLVSIYKHNSSLLKRTGQIVKAGDVIAISGNSGENTTGPHLHFELWYNGLPINPRNYIQF